MNQFEVERDPPVVATQPLERFEPARASRPAGETPGARAQRVAAERAQVVEQILRRRPGDGQPFRVHDRIREAGGEQLVADVVQVRQRRQPSPGPALP